MRRLIVLAATIPLLCATPTAAQWNDNYPPGGRTGPQWYERTYQQPRERAVQPKKYYRTKLAKPRRVTTQTTSRQTCGSGRPTNDRRFLSAAASGLLAGLEQVCGKQKVVKTCCPGCAIARTGRISRHSSGDAFDTEHKSGASKACALTYLRAKSRGYVLTYSWLPKVVHADIAPGAAAEAEPKQWPVAKVEAKAASEQPTPKPDQFDRPVPVERKNYSVASLTDVVNEDASPIKKTEWQPVLYANSVLNWTPKPLPADPTPRGSTLKEDIKNASALFNVDERMMLAFAAIESSGNCKARTGSYKGAFQLSEFEHKRYWHGDIYDCWSNTYAAARKFATEAEQFENDVGRKASAFELYCIHQQGYQGCAFHHAAPWQLAWKNMFFTAEGQRKGEAWAKKAIWGNVPWDAKHRYKGGVNAMTSADFLALWTARVNRFMARYSNPNKVQFAKAKAPKKLAAKASKKKQVAAKAKRQKLARR